MLRTILNREKTESVDLINIVYFPQNIIDRFDPKTMDIIMRKHCLHFVQVGVVDFQLGVHRP